MELKNLCRICLIKCENEITYSIFTDETILKLNLCGGLSIAKNLDLPEQMCEHCYQSLENAHKFRITCQISEKRLKELATNPTSREKTKGLIGFGDRIKIELPDNIEKQQNFSCILETQTDIVEPESNKVETKRKYTRKKIKEKSEKIVGNDQLTCPICQIDYKAKNAFVYHMRRHRNEMDFICEFCGTAFETNFKLLRHYNKHTGVKKYPCRTCDISFPTSSNRDRHERRLHTTIRPFQCEYCIKVFAYSDQLKNHVRVHTGEKPFICEKCGTGFRRKSHLITHNKAITPCFLKKKETNEVNSKRIRTIKSIS